MERLLQTAYIEWIPAELRNQFAHGLLGCRILTTIHHYRFHVVAGVRRILEVLETVDCERLDYLGIRYEFLDHFRTGLDAIQSMTEVGADGIGAVDKNLALYLVSNSLERRFVSRTSSSSIRLSKLNLPGNPDNL